MYWAKIPNTYNNKTYWVMYFHAWNGDRFDLDNLKRHLLFITLRRLGLIEYVNDHGHVWEIIIEDKQR